MSQVVEVGQIEIRYFELQRRARSLRAEVLARGVCAPWQWLRTRVEQVRAPIDLEPLEY
jgi:hypothetical protein